jgi:hypothetical protein
MSRQYKDISGNESAYQFTEGFQMISHGEVVDVFDDKNLGRIKVKLFGPATAGGDKNITSISELAWCTPLLPKMFSVTPKVGEVVIIFQFNQNTTHVDRLYLGPIISQPNKLRKDTFIETALAGFTFGHQETTSDIRLRPELVGVYPNIDDISVQGRYNTEVTQKENEIIIRAGKFVEVAQNPEAPFGIEFNKTSQGYFQLKNNTIIGNNQKGTITNIVSNKINLLTHNGSPSFNLNNKNGLISEFEMVKIISPEELGGAHRLPFGDVLLEYLKLLKNALLLHVHNNNGLTPTDLTTSGNIKAVEAFKLKAADLENRMLSNNIRIN